MTGCSATTRHRLFDLWRQPADHAVLFQQARAAARPWSNSLFEDNAEFGLGLHLAVEQRASSARELMVTRLVTMAGIGLELAESLLKADQSTETGIAEQRNRVVCLRAVIKNLPQARMPGGSRPSRTIS